MLRHALDRLLSKLVSRKLMVWLQSGDWVAISLAYIGIQGLADIAREWKHGK